MDVSWFVVVFPCWDACRQVVSCRGIATIEADRSPYHKKPVRLTLLGRYNPEEFLLARQLKGLPAMRVIAATIALLLTVPVSLADADRGVEDLGADLLGGGLLDELAAPESGDDQPATAPLPDIDELRRMLEQPEGTDLGESSGESPLASVHQKMQTAESLIQGHDTSGKTKQVQGEIVDELDQLIAKLQEQCKKCSGGQCNKPGSSQQQTAKSTPKPGAANSQQAQQSNSPSQAQPDASQQAATQSNARPNGGETSAASDAVDPQAMLKDVWGELPERMRQQMLQSSFDDFLPEYRDDIEAYFRQLAEPE